MSVICFAFFKQLANLLRMWNIVSCLLVLPSEDSIWDAIVFRVQIISAVLHTTSFKQFLQVK